MRLIDTHAHLYLPDFDADRSDLIASAVAKGIDTMLLPNIDKDSIGPLKLVCEQYHESCKPMMGLHPTSVKEDFEAQLQSVKDELAKGMYIAVGEIGIDLYWSRDFEEQQIIAFREQLRLASQYRIPVAIHTREAFPLILDLVEKEKTDDLRGVFHCFTGTSEDAYRIIQLGFYMGIGGVITYKKSNLPQVVSQISADHLLLETDAPFLPPVPFRGKRNESAYLIYIAQKLAEVMQTDMESIAHITTQNAIRLFNC
ncbi:MAG: TatD family hydrolase [Bacteroidales bacterium]|nr:TatD family hydrolase [Bacteroidales bacterium]